MDPEPKDVMVLGAIKKGAKKFDKIQKETRIEAEELNKILEKLEERSLIRVETKKGLFGPKIEISTTEKGEKELSERIHELEQHWNQMTVLWKSKDKEKFQQYMDDNRSILPMMMFFGIIDIMMFSTMLSFIGAQMNDYVPAEQIPEGAGDMDGGMGDGGYDIDIGF
jgi:DNA-binding HxlR family transcriptional regulator